MSARSFLIWTVLALASLVAAFAVSLGQPETAKVELANEPVFPALRADPDVVAKVSLTTTAGEVVVGRDDQGAWRVESKAGYAADAKKVRALVVGLSDMRLAKAMTKNPERFARLEVEDHDAEGAQSRLIRLEGKGGQVLAEMLLGKSRAGYTAGSEGGSYLRRVGENQAWLATGSLEIESEPVDWLVKEVVNIDDDQVKSVEITPPEGEAFAVARPESDAEFSLDRLPEGRSLEESEVNRLASGLAFVNLDDVTPKSEAALTGTPHKARFTTFDGLAVTAELFAQQGEGEARWVVFAAEQVGEGESEEAQAARALAAEINARVEGWAYRLPSYVDERLTMPLEKLLSESDGTS